MPRKRSVIPNPPLPHVPTGVRLHKCSVCGKEERWSDQWSYYGSIEMEDDGAPLLKTCSSACRDRVPDPEQMLADIWATLKYEPPPPLFGHHRMKLKRKGRVLTQWGLQ